MILSNLDLDTGSAVLSAVLALLTAICGAAFWVFRRRHASQREHPSDPRGGRDSSKAAAIGAIAADGIHHIGSESDSSGSDDDNNHDDDQDDYVD